MARVISFSKLIALVTLIASIPTATVLNAEGAALFQEAYVKASNTGREDYFGGSAISGNTLAVGASGEHSSATGINGDQSDNSARFAGAVYVFTREDGLWTQQAYIKASNTDPVDSFGGAVALSGDTLAVGASGESSSATGTAGNQSDNSADDSGAVYVFTRVDGVWSQQAYIKASNTDDLDHFGLSIAISGDTLAVGAPSEASGATGIDGDQADNSAPGAGAVYVFTRTEGVWAQQAYVKASNTGAGDSFAGVALSGNTLAVGASGEGSAATGIDGDQSDDSAPYSGAAYVFTRTDGVWSQQAYVKASNTEAEDGFGAVTLSGNALVVGANAEDSAATGIDGDQTGNSAYQAGAGYLFTRTEGVWSQQAYIKASNTDSWDRFITCAASGDTIVATAVYEGSNSTGIDGDQADNSLYGAGAAYVFRIESETIFQDGFEIP